MDLLALGSFIALAVAWIALPLRMPVVAAEQKKAALARDAASLERDREYRETP